MLNPVRQPVPCRGQRRQKKSAEGELFKGRSEEDSKDTDYPDRRTRLEEVVDRERFRNGQEIREELHHKSQAQAGGEQQGPTPAGDATIPRDAVQKSPKPHQWEE